MAVERGGTSRRHVFLIDIGILEGKDGELFAK